MLFPSLSNPANKLALKAKLAAVISRLRESYVGSSYSISDLTYDTKSECLKLDIPFDPDLFNLLLLKP